MYRLGQIYRLSLENKDVMKIVGTIWYCH